MREGICCVLCFKFLLYCGLYHHLPFVLLVNSMPIDENLINLEVKTVQQMFSPNICL